MHMHVIKDIVLCMINWQKLERAKYASKVYFQMVLSV